MTPTRVAAGAASLITVLLLQAALIGPLTLPLPVSLPAVFVAAVALRAGPSTGMALGFTAGLVTDLASAHPLGVLALSWLALGVAAGSVGGLVDVPAALRHRPRSALRHRPRSALRHRPRSAARRSAAHGVRGRWGARRSGLSRHALAVGILTAAASVLTAVVLLAVGAAPQTLGTALLQGVPAGIVDAVLALGVVPAVRAALDSPALRSAPTVPERASV